VGHDVVTVNEAGLTGSSDAVVLAYAKQDQRVLLTHNCDDFEVFHEANPSHSGILAIYKDSDYSKDMNRQTIVKAIANLEAAGVSPTKQFIALNQWKY
jgi:predicted nuclease of predicted toxin-antitoxin system